MKTRLLILLACPLLAASCTSPQKNPLDGLGHTHRTPPHDRDLIVEDCETSLVAVGSRTKSVLGVLDDTLEQDVTDALTVYGIGFSEGFRAYWEPRLGAVVVRNLPHEVCKVRGLVSLLDQGFTITKGTNANEASQAIGAEAAPQPER